MAEETTQQYLRRLDVDKRLIESIDNGIIILDDNLQIIYFNKWLEIHTKLKAQDLIGKQLHMVFPSIRVKPLQRKINTALKMNSPTFYIATTTKYLIPIQINQIKASGFSYMRQNISIIPFDTDKRLVSLIITDQTSIVNTNNLLEANIQKVKELNQELLAEKDIVDQRVISIKIDINHAITELSRAFLNLIDLKEIQINLKNYFECEIFLLDTQTEKEILSHIQEMKVYEFESKVINSDEKEISLLNTLVPEYNKNGTHIGFVIFCTNITDAKLVQEHQKRLLESSRTSAMGEMISMIAHQWRQPLSVITTVIATLKIKKELDVLNDTIINESYTKIEETVIYLSETIDDFRNFFMKNKELEKLSIKHLFDKANNLLESEMKIHSIEYIENINPELTIITYKNELTQTLINIIKNSLDEFQNNSQTSPKIIVSVNEKSEHINIVIEDNAGGIPDDIIKKVFEPYFSTKAKNGTGLGLYVCKTIIQDHLQGTIRLESIGKQTKVIIELPKKLGFNP